jgi:hypothetical protein
MIVNGFNPGVTMPEQKFTNLEKEKLAQEISREKESLRSEESKKEKVHEDSSKFAMNDYHLKELLFLMTSRGNSETIEKLAQLLKKEREMISRIK